MLCDLACGRVEQIAYPRFQQALSLRCVSAVSSKKQPACCCGPSLSLYLRAACVLRERRSEKSTTAAATLGATHRKFKSASLYTFCGSKQFRTLSGRAQGADGGLRGGSIAHRDIKERPLDGACVCVCGRMGGWPFGRVFLLSQHISHTARVTRELTHSPPKHAVSAQAGRAETRQGDLRPCQQPH